MRPLLISVIGVGCMGMMGMIGACTPDPVEAGADTIIDGIVRPNVDGLGWATHVDNPYFPLPVGAKWHYGANTPAGDQRKHVEVLAETRAVNGVDATVVYSISKLDNTAVEETWDWYAQDVDGNVWQLGTSTCEWRGGECVISDSAWEWGVDGALPGYIMRTRPRVDHRPYFQAYAAGVVEDVAEVIGAHESKIVTAGKFHACVRTHETSTIDPSRDKERVYCPGVGNVFVAEPGFDVHLISYEGL